MRKKLVLTLALAICFTFIGCSFKMNDENSKKDSSEKSATQTSAAIHKVTTSQEKVLVKVIVKKKLPNNEKTYDKPEDIKVFKTAIETGVLTGKVNMQLKAPPYDMHFYYSDNEKVGYFLYISPNSSNNGWIYNTETFESYNLSKDSHNDLIRILTGM